MNIRILKDRGKPLMDDIVKGSHIFYCGVNCANKINCIVQCCIVVSLVIVC